MGSRTVERAQAAAKNIQKAVGTHSKVYGFTNQDAVSRADIVVVAVPFNALPETLKSLKSSFRSGQVVVSVTVPLETAVGGSPTRTLGIWEGSAGELASRLLPKGTRVVSAFNNVSAELLNDLSREVDCDVLVCGDDEGSKKVAIELAMAIPGVRGFDAGPLENSRTIEQLTALLVSLNIRHGVKNAGLRVTGLSPD